MPSQYAQGVGYGGGDGGDSKLRLNDASGTVILTAGGGAGSKTTVQGGVQGPIRVNGASTGGTATVNTSISSGSPGFVYSAGAGTTSGGTTITNADARNGNNGPAGGTCSGDNCAIAGLDGADNGFGFGGGAGGSTSPSAGNNALNGGGGGGGGGTTASIVRNGGSGGAGYLTHTWVRI